MKKRKIYIAGKVTGEDKLKCATKFSKAKTTVERNGFLAINPLEVVGTWNVEWPAAMKKCVEALIHCDAVLMLPCSKVSKGAKIEIQLAWNLEIPVYTHIDMIKMAEENGEL